LASENETSPMTGAKKGRKAQWLHFQYNRIPSDPMSLQTYWKALRGPRSNSALAEHSFTSGVTSKPASRGHFKTGQLSASRTAIFLPYRQ
jgi:hypothetical protein